MLKTVEYGKVLETVTFEFEYYCHYKKFKIQAKKITMHYPNKIVLSVKKSSSSVALWLSWTQKMQTKYFFQ